MAADDQVRFERDDTGRVILIQGVERSVLGDGEAVAAEMARFLAEMDFADFGGG